MSLQVKASLGTKVIAQSVPYGLCRITLHNLKTQDEFHCTGSVIGKNIIKTAAHCLHNSEFKEINCIGADEITVVDHLVYPDYNQDLLESDILNRDQDQTLIKVFQDLSSISTIALTDTSSINLDSFSQCLIAGFGLQERSLTKTGFLSASLIPNHRELIKLDSGIITVNGAYLVELLPGDSGGPLLCFKNGNWFDLGTASAHTWEHESIYSANANLDFSDWPLTTEQNEEASAVKSYALDESNKPKFLAPYSLVTTLEGVVLYNGDLDYVRISDITEYDENTVKAQIKVDSASINFLCLGQFLCYGDTFEVLIEKKYLRDTRNSYPLLFDPFL